MTRINESEYTHRPADDRAVDGTWVDFTGVVDADLLLVRDVELGPRASERVDFLEDETDIRYWTDLAVIAAMTRGETR